MAAMQILTLSNYYHWELSINQRLTRIMHLLLARQKSALTALALARLAALPSQDADVHDYFTSQSQTQPLALKYHTACTKTEQSPCRSMVLSHFHMQPYK